MPCRDYESDHYNTSRSRDLAELKKQADRLARIACAAMTALEAEGKEDFLLLQNDEVREWWDAHKIADEKARVERETKKKLAALRKAALAKLSPDDIKVLDIKLRSES
jgi:hypothetical protein